MMVEIMGKMVIAALIVFISVKFEQILTETETTTILIN